jgi:TolA-binding protein
MTRRLPALVLLVFLVAWPLSAPAAALLPLTPPPPDLAALVPFAEAPIEKPPIAVADLPLPPSPSELPAMPLAPIVMPVVPKPTAPTTPTGTLACVGAAFGIASKALECGRAHFAKGEWDDAVHDLEAAVRRGKERELLTEARYWLAETYYRLDRIQQADALFRQVARGPRLADFTVWSLHSSGWTALRLNDMNRARDTFAQFQSATPAELEAWARLGLGLSNYALGRHDEAVAAWTALSSRPPATLVREVFFWLGEGLGRVGQYDRAITSLTQFVQGGPHPLLDTGRVRLGWWSLAAERYPESVAAFRAYLASPRTAPERPWAEAGLAMALLPSDPEAAKNLLRGLESRRSPLVVPLQIRMARALIESKKPAEVPALTQDLLGATLTNAIRAHVLLLKGEGYRLAGNRDEARTQYELSQRMEPNSPTGWYAAYRLAQANFELREYAQASRDLPAVVTGAPSPDARVAALLLRGEAAYYTPDYGAAAAAFRRAIAEVPGNAQAPAARLGLGWSLMRHDKLEEARKEFLEFAKALPGDPLAPDALELASELALRREADREEARQLLDRVITTYPSSPRTEFARLNRAILMIRTGDPSGAEAPLRDWIRRAPFPPLLGRAQAALGAALLAAGRPVEAATAFKRAQAEGVGPLAALGLGSTALAEGQWAQASSKLTEARDGGTAEVAAVAGYGLAVVAFQQGNAMDFKQPAQAALQLAPRARSAPRLLYVLTAIAVDEKDWPGAVATAKRLASEFPTNEAADDAFERVGAGAAAAAAWPTVIEAYTLMEKLYPQSPFLEPARVTIAEAQVETGKPDVARPVLEQFVATAPSDSRTQRAWLALARARDAAGDRAGALDAYTRALKDQTVSDLRPEMALGYARVLTHEKRWDEARKVLDRLVRTDDKSVVAAAAGAIGETYQGEGDNLAAAEYFMTAAYVAPESPAGRNGLLGAGACFAALKQNDAAAIVYQKLLAQKDAPADVLEKARKGLKDIGR